MARERQLWFVIRRSGCHAARPMAVGSWSWATPNGRGWKGLTSVRTKFPKKGCAGVRSLWLKARRMLRPKFADSSMTASPPFARKMSAAQPQTSPTMSWPSTWSMRSSKWVLRRCANEQRHGSARSKNAIGVEVRDLTVGVSGDTAFAHSLNRYFGKLKRRGTIDMCVRDTLCLRKISGQWLITHEHNSVPFDSKSGTAVISADVDRSGWRRGRI